MSAPGAAQRNLMRLDAARWERFKHQNFPVDIIELIDNSYF